jgi:hypothetical protein
MNPRSTHLSFPVTHDHIIGVSLLENFLIHIGRDFSNTNRSPAPTQLRRAYAVRWHLLHGFMICRRLKIAYRMVVDSE